MTELQASLMAIGGAIVVGVVSYNKWQEYKAKKTVERAFSTQGEDVLMRPASNAPQGGQRQEPILEERPTDISPPVVDEGTAIVQTEEAPAAPVKSAPNKDLPVDHLLDCVIPLALENPVRGEKLLPMLQALRQVGGKPVHFIGQRDDGAWEPVAYGSVYRQLQAGVQLANRGSALNEIEYSELVMRLRQLSDDLGAEPDAPDMIHVMSASRELHQFVAEYDAQLSINVQANGAPWAIATLLAALERQGFDLRPDGRLVMPDGDNGILFSLSTNVTLAAETTTRLTLLMDVPRVAQSKGGFGAMVACARSLAVRLDGTVVDDAGHPLSDTALSEIAAQLDTFYTDMEAAEIPAGSVRALRLFS